MAKLLIRQPQKRGRIAIPDLEEQLRIISDLLKLKHFDGIWYNGGTLTVRRFRDPQETPVYLPWAEAKRMVEVAANLPMPKPPGFQKTLRVVSKAAGE